MTTCRYINSGQSNFEYEYIGEFETEFKNILGHESGAQVCSFDGKKQRSKISCYCPFNGKFWLTAMLNSGAIWLAAKYLAANFDWPLYYIADIDDLPLY